MRATALLLVAVFGACTPCHPNHSGVCEGAPITPVEQVEVQQILDDLRTRADTSTHITLGGAR